MARPQQQEKAPSRRLFLAEGQPDNHERLETIDTTKVEPWGNVTPKNLQQWVTHNPENTCRCYGCALHVMVYGTACYGLYIEFSFIC